MPNKLTAKLGSLWKINEEFRLKVLYLSLIFALFTGCQSVWRPLKNAIFSKIIGAEFYPDAKLYSLLILVPLIILYSKLVDWLRRHQLLYVFTLFHGIGGLLFSLILIHPVYGVANTDSSPARLVGWFFYIFMESFTAFMSATFWSFANSVNNHKDAKNFYGIFVVGSKVGGIVAAGFLYLSLRYAPYSDSVLLTTNLLLGSLMLFGAAAAVYALMKAVPGYYMHGYEAAYQLEKKRPHDKNGFIQTIIESLEGLFIIIKNPYVLGVFSLVMFYEIMIVIFDYRVLRIADSTHATAGGLASFYALYYLCMHGVGLIVALFGTTPFQRAFGTRLSLFAFPALSIILIGITYVIPCASTFFIVLVLLRALNYALNHPTKEILYIPTTKAIKFKAKAWSDAFGSRIAKGTGSLFNLAANHMSAANALLTSTILNAGLGVIWLIVVYFLGKTVQEAINTKTVIGSNPDDPEQSEQ